MRKIQAIAAALRLLFALKAGAQNQPVSDDHKVNPLPKPAWPLAGYPRSASYFMALMDTWSSFRA
jgi:hypothetical protein